MNKLSLIHKKIFRAVSNVGHYEHTQPLFVQLDILKLDDMYEIETLKFMHQYVNGELPSSLHNIFVNTSTIHNYDTRQSRHILWGKIRAFNTSLGSNSPSGFE
jgi:hypothetical protein